MTRTRTTVRTALAAALCAVAAKPSRPLSPPRPPPFSESLSPSWRAQSLACCRPFEPHSSRRPRRYEVEGFPQPTSPAARQGPSW